MTDSLVTDELVERAAKEGCGFMALPDGALTHDFKVYFAGFDLRAALLTIAPSLHAAGYRAGLERAAEVATAIALDPDRISDGQTAMGRSSRIGWTIAANECASAIRAEKEPRHD